MVSDLYQKVKDLGMKFRLRGHGRVQIYDEVVDQTCEMSELESELELVQDLMDLYMAIERTKV